MLANILKLTVTTNLKTVSRYTLPNGFRRRLSTVAPVRRVSKDTQLKSAFVSKSDMTYKSATDEATFSLTKVPLHILTWADGEPDLCYAWKNLPSLKKWEFFYRLLFFSKPITPSFLATLPCHARYKDNWARVKNFPFLSFLERFFIELAYNHNTT